MKLTAAGPVLLILYVFTYAVTMQYFLQMLQSVQWQVREYYNTLMRENLRWLPVIFSLIPGAAVAMGYGTSAYMVSAAYNAAMLLLYWPWPGRASRPEWTGKMKRLMGFWALYLVFLSLILYAFAGRRNGVLSVGLAVAFLIQPALAILLEFIDRPSAKWLSRHFIRGSEEILSLHHDLRIIVVSGSDDAPVLRGALREILSACYSCETASQIVHTRIDAAQIIRDRTTATLEYLICHIDADSEEEARAILEALHPDLQILASADYYSLLGELLPEGEHCLRFINGDDRVLRQFIGTETVMTYGLDKSNDCAGRIETVDEEGTEFTVEGVDYPGFHTHLLGAENITALIGAISVSYSLGIPGDLIQEHINRVRPLPHRLELIRHSGIRNTILIDDSANEEPLAGEEALDVLRQFSGMRILITDGFLRQGVIQEESNRNYGGKAARICDRIILVGKEVAYGLRSGILGNGYRPENLFEASDRGAAISMADGWECGERKVILLEAPGE